MAERIILEVHQVSKHFGGLKAVDQVSFTVREHEVMGIIGPNGSGKTTMMNLISGALQPTSGDISLDEHLISGRPAREIARAGVGRTFQLVRVLPGLSVLENVMAGAVFGHKRLWGRELQRHAERQLERVGLGHAKGLPTSALTYIDEKRVELARALAGDPKVLLLDEWLAGLNPTELQTGIALIRSLRDDGRTVILVEHVMDAIRSLCDRCIVMSSGAKIAEGTPEQALSDPGVITAYLGADHA
ncbi:MAG: ABC transporter ATP-binding protein [Rubrivivax sp.]|jgi:branched-chain amino acid transport system ATP-binding protein|nr:ABC transporter ATP-binding protein [Rubrivivax sp.]